MLARSSSVNFRDHIEFFEAIYEMGKSVNISETGNSEDKFIFLSAPFATIIFESYYLFNCMSLNIFEISPKADIHIPYDFDSDILGIEYIADGSYILDKNGFTDKVGLAKDLFISPESAFMGNMVFHNGKPSKTIAFGSSKKILHDLLGESGNELWSEALKTGNFTSGNRLHLLRSPQCIASSFLQILNCDYPNQTKRLFFESKFMEILSRIVAKGLPVEENDEDTFELEQIKMIPEILMDRINNPPSIPELAHELSLNSTTMKKGFKNMFGEPIYAHHRNKCLNLAATLLLETDKSVLEIAADIGYSNSGNFGNAFKKRYGVSPSLYRQKGKFSL
jgi:AraC-like DNA-binding protein